MERKRRKMDRTMNTNRKDVTSRKDTNTETLAVKDESKTHK